MYWKAKNGLHIKTSKNTIKNAYETDIKEEQKKIQLLSGMLMSSGPRNQ
jgi:hypothetical protein